MNSKDRFQKAVRESLNQLVANGEKKITHAKIIANAKYEDGSPVGKTTLYAKNAVTKEPIHGTLIDEINTKIANLPKNDFSKKKTSIETNKELKLRITELEEKNNQLLIQMVEIENSFENTAHRNDENQIQDLEAIGDKYWAECRYYEKSKCRGFLPVCKISEYEKLFQ